MLFTVALHEDFVNVEDVSVALMPPLQSPCIFGSELDTSEANGFIADSDFPFSKETLDIPTTENEAIVEPDSVANDVGREAMAFIGIHPPILAICAR
jgi:hypothetical protein